ncbi:MAG: hypothetical protein K2M94_06165 [Paramuribaculum sp.]|nr:hypothetical protein [Paramuribaculum sp.]
MKRLLSIVLAFVIGLTAVSYAQSKEYIKEKVKNEKTANKLAKKMAKELKKEKWQSSGAVTLETALANYYLETEPTCGGVKKGIEHTVVDAKTLSMAEKRLLLEAQALYAQEVRTMLAQSITEQDSSTGTDELATYISNIAAKSQNEFNGDVERAFIIYKTNPDGQSMTVRAFYVIDKENGLARARSIAEKVKQNNDIQKEIQKAVNN